MKYFTNVDSKSEDSLPGKKIKIERVTYEILHICE